MNQYKPIADIESWPVDLLHLSRLRSASLELASPNIIKHLEAKHTLRKKYLEEKAHILEQERLALNIYVERMASDPDTKTEVHRRLDEIEAEARRERMNLAELFWLLHFSVGCKTDKAANSLRNGLEALLNRLRARAEKHELEAAQKLSEEQLEKRRKLADDPAEERKLADRLERLREQPRVGVVWDEENVRGHRAFT